MASVEVFVDDAVQGTLPEICVKTGQPALGCLRVDRRVPPLGAGWVLLLIVLGPVGWIVLAILEHRRERLSLRLPYSEEVVDNRTRLSRVCFGSVVVAIVLAVTASATRHSPVCAVFVVAAIGALVAAVLTGMGVMMTGVGVALDASRRWVTLSGVHPAFVHAVEETEQRATQSAAV